MGHLRHKEFKNVDFTHAVMGMHFHFMSMSYIPAPWFGDALLSK